MKLRETHSLQFYRALVRRCYYSYRRVLIFRTRTEKGGIGGKLFSLGTRRLSRRIFLLSKGITINFSSLFFFFLIRNGKYLDDLGLYEAFNLTNMMIYVTLFLCKKIRDSRVFKFLDSSKHASLELKIVINLRGGYLINGI